MTPPPAHRLAPSALRPAADRQPRDTVLVDFVQRTGGGTDGTPLIRFHWPDDITPPRGQDWWVPSPLPRA